VAPMQQMISKIGMVAYQYANKMKIVKFGNQNGIGGRMKNRYLPNVVIIEHQMTNFVYRLVNVPKITIAVKDHILLGHFYHFRYSLLLQLEFMGFI